MTKDTRTAETKKDSYPLFDLEPCIQFCEHIKDLGGSKTAVKKSLLAKQVGLSETTPSFFQRIGSSKTFGIIDGWGSYFLTETGKSYFYPQSEEDRRQAQLSMLAKPSAFNFILKRFDGEKLPPNEMVGNILHQELGIPDSWKDRLALLFLKSAKYVSIIDDGGYLRYDAEMHTTNGNVAASGQKSTSQLTTQSVVAEPDDSAMTRYPRKPASASPGHTVWAYPHKGSYIRLETPEDMPKELWEKLQAYVEILKPIEHS